MAIHHLRYSKINANMKICLAQTQPVRGAIQRNIDNHKTFIELALSCGAETIIFPELSLTGYEPELAEALATDLEDSRFDVFQNLSNTGRITIGVGVPTKSDTGICISMILFQPYQERQLYSKKYIHPDEEPFFVRGDSRVNLAGSGARMALAICYELSVPEHVENAVQNGAEWYIASVVKFVSGIDKALHRLAEIAHTYSMTVFMANSVGQSDGHPCAGKTSVWNNRGALIGQLDDTSEGILLFDTATEKVTEQLI